MGSGEIGVGSTREKQRMGAWRHCCFATSSRSDGHAPVVVTQAVPRRRWTEPAVAARMGSMSFDDDIELPWPRPGDVLFGEAPDWWMNACVNYGGGLMYAIGYRTGGDARVIVKCCG